MNRRAVGVLAVLVAVATALMVWMVFLRGWGRGTEATAVGSGAARRATEPTPAPATAEAPRGRAPAWTLDADREGPLRLEGQVLGPDGAPAAGATVTLASLPPRTMTAEEDGTFAFDKLVGRTYDLTARKDLTIGVVRHKLTLAGDPAVIRLAEGAAIEVTVTDEAAAPIAGATVSTDGRAELSATTDAAGTARLAPVTPGWVDVEARAPGYAPGSLLAPISSAAAGATRRLTLTLKKGFAVAGTVVDDTGAAVASVRVAPRLSFGMGQGEPVTTDDAGRFTLPALPPGRHELTATDGQHAPTRSTPITVADRAVSGITITMKAGARITGRVIDDARQPVPFAIVRVARFGADTWQPKARQVSADQDGAFEITGLTRTTLKARAESDAAASKVAALDLTDKAELTGVELVLDVRGQLAGTVVDDKGAAVAEVTVNAFPALLDDNALEWLALTGTSSTTTDGAGAFAIHSLTDGAYRLMASRSSSSAQGGAPQVTGRTGDTGIKLVLPAPGELTGTIKLEGDTAPPAIASVQVGLDLLMVTPAQAGVFTARGLTPGTYDVTFRGPQFADTIKRAIAIKPGATTDMGTVTVVRGRRLTGTVVDKSGSPVAGAKIKVGASLFNTEGIEDQLADFESQRGIRVAVSDQDGRFTISGVPKQETTAIAAHLDRGRSLGTTIPAGTDDVGPIKLTLRGYGSVTGTVTRKGKPLGKATVGWSSKGGSASAAFGQTADDGTFTFARVPEGTVIVAMQATQDGMMTMKATSVTIEVTAGRPTTATIDIPVGEITLTVTIKPAAGAQVDAARVFLFNGTVAYVSGKQLTDAMFAGGGQGMKVWLGKALPMPVFDELVAGTYSACSIPITGSMNDPTLMQRIEENLATMKGYCKQVTVKPAPLAQSLTQELPSMEPLPAPTE